MNKEAPVRLFIVIDNSFIGNARLNVLVPVMRIDKGSSHI